MSNQFVQQYDSSSEAYSKAYKIFLEHTDQKKNMHAWLLKIIKKLAKKEVFIDSGAGNGEVTKEYLPLFNKTIAIEPNPFLWGQLKKTTPTATIIAKPIKDAEPSLRADLVLCSHILYYIPLYEWMETLEYLSSWITPTGQVIVVLQDYETDCMAMLEHFFNQRYDLKEISSQFSKKYENHYNIKFERESAYVETNDFNTAYLIAEFMLNLVPFKNPPTREEFENYIQFNFKTADNKYRFSCHQDFLQIQRK